MISLKSNFIIASIFFILQILKVFGEYDFGLYAVTSTISIIIIADAKTGEIKKSKGIQNDGFNIKNNNNYIYSNVTDDIYLPTFSNGELTILHWNFDEKSNYAYQLTVNGVSDIDPTYQPKDLNTTDSGSSSSSSSSS
ncbi:hypothetical protein ACTFIR_005223 [Dictyostelium discoideum]